MDNMYPTHGILAQSVTPNAKCEGCLHYAANNGPTGLCQIGLRPFNCGSGESPTMGYAPLVSQTPTQPMEAAPVAQATATGAAPSRDVEQRQVSLGPEFTPIVKSLYEEMAAESASSCPLHQQRSAQHGTTNPHAQINVGCQCAPVSMHKLTKALKRRLPNLVKSVVSDAEIFEYVEKATENMKKFWSPQHAMETAQRPSVTKPVKPPRTFKEKDDAALPVDIQAQRQEARKRAHTTGLMMQFRDISEKQQQQAAPARPKPEAFDEESSGESGATAVKKPKKFPAGTIKE